MSTTHHLIHPLRHAGRSQTERLVAALLPKNLRIDERSLQDLLVAAHRYAKLLHYYDENNQIEGDWTAFWEVETLTFLAILAELDTEVILQQFNKLEIGFAQDIPNGAGGPFDPGGESIINFYDQTVFLTELVRQINQAHQLLPEDHPLRAEIRGMIDKKDVFDGENLVDALHHLIAIHKDTHGNEHGGLALPTVDYAEFFASLSESSTVPEQDGLWQLKDGDAFEAIKFQTDYDRGTLRTLFRRFYEVLVKIRSRANFWFEQESSNPKLHEPHIALFLTFLRLFRHAQNSLNTLTGRHLDYYYEEILCLARRAEVADEVYLVLELAKGFEAQLIEKGTEFLAGKDANGQPLIYAALENYVVRGARVAELKTIYLGKNEEEKPELYATPDVREAYRNGEVDPAGEVISWRSLGDDLELPKAELGFAIASPQLILREGWRMIEVEITLASEIGLDETSLANGIQPLLSSGEEWIEPQREENFSTYSSGDTEPIFGTAVFTASGSENIIRLQIILQRDDLPVVALAGEQDRYGTSWPILKVLLQPNEKRSGLYEKLRKANLERVKIWVWANGIRENLIVQNDQGVFDGTRKMFPFGPAPVIGGQFYLGSTEVFQKALTELKINFNWIGADENLNKYYCHYLTEGEQFSPRLHVGLIDRASSTMINQSDVEPGESEGETGHEGSHGDFSVYSGISLIKSERLEKEFLLEVETLDLNRDTTNQSFTEYNPTLNRGFLKFTLEGRDFGHMVYPTLMAQYSLHAVNKDVPLPNGEKKCSNQPLPNPPYTPATNGISLDYSSAQVVYDRDKDEENTIDKFFHLLPFGGYRTAILKSEEETPLLEAFAPTGKRAFSPETDDAPNTIICANGNLYIGLENLTPGSNLSLLFQIEEGTEREPDLQPPDLTWSYLAADNNWTRLRTTDILSDATRGLTKSGLVLLSIPKLARRENTMLNPELHWLRIAGTEENDGTVRALPSLVSVTAQALKARFSNRKNKLDHLAASLPASTISKLAVSQAAIRKVAQPFASFGGRLPEVGNEFYRRISEQLAHRQRAITLRDYEQLLLEAFPGVQRVKCLPHTRPQTGINCPNDPQNEQFDLCVKSPGYVTVVAVPDLSRRTATRQIAPRFSFGDLLEMEEFLRAKTNLFVSLKKGSIQNLCLPSAGKTKEDRYLWLVNPLYQPVRVCARIVFHAGYDVEYYRYELSKELTNYLAPWMSDLTSDIAFDRTLSQSGILTFIEQREYVDIVAELEVYTASAEQANLLSELEYTATVSPDKEGIRVAGDRIRTLTPRAVLTSFAWEDQSVESPDHCIVEIDNSEIDCTEVSTQTGN